MIAYGDYGVGKTKLVGSAAVVPQMRDILFIDAESGDLTIATEEDDKNYKESAAKYIDVVRVRTFRELARVAEYLKVHCQFRDADDEENLKRLEAKLMPQTFDPKKPARRYRTVILDSLSEAETYSLYQLLGITDKTRIDEDTATAEFKEYKLNHGQVLRMIRSFRDLPMHVLMTSASSFIQDDSKKMIMQPALTGKLAKNCQGFMDIIGYMYVTTGEEGKKVHVMQVQPSARVNAKCRFSNFKEMGWSNPTLLSILKSVDLLDKDKLR